MTAEYDPPAEYALPDDLLDKLAEYLDISPSKLEFAFEAYARHLIQRGLLVGADAGPDIGDVMGGSTDG